jgi:hypothetical protein
MKALLIGNDINNATQQYSWKQLLQDLMEYARLETPLQTEGKPFPLLYEQIFLNAARQYGTREKRIKTYIAVKTLKLMPNPVHQQIMKLNIPVVLTTNYDLTLEQVLTKQADKIPNSGIIKENLYSLYRVHSADAFNIWHIHGHAMHPQSITLGYEHYSGYLQQMRNYVVSGINRNGQYPSLLRRLKENAVNHTSWIDYFFTHDVHILGLNLDFVEIHLWWLLTFRARLRLQNKISCTNTIYYYYPHRYEAASKHKLELLRANEVTTIPLIIKSDNRLGYYDRVLKMIDKG